MDDDSITGGAARITGTSLCKMHALQQRRVVCGWMGTHYKEMFSIFLPLFKPNKTSFNYLSLRYNLFSSYYVSLVGKVELLNLNATRPEKPRRACFEVLSFLARWTHKWRAISLLESFGFKKEPLIYTHFLCLHNFLGSLHFFSPFSANCAWE